MQLEGRIKMKVKTLLISGFIVAAGIGTYMYFSAGAKGLTSQDFEMITLATIPSISNK